MRSNCGALRRSIIFVVLLSSLVAPANASLSNDEEKLLGAISLHRMVTTINRLCSRDFGGRRAGSPENKAVADYLVSRFRSAGLYPLPGINGYLQSLTMRYSLVKKKDEIEAVLTYAVQSNKGMLQRMRRFSYRDFNGNGGIKLKSKVVFVGYGINDSQSGYDDYSGINVNGKIVLWISGKPPMVANLSAATLAHKIATAYQQGAVACLIYNPHVSQEGFGANIGLSGPIADFPCITIDRKVANELLAPAGLNIEQLASMKPLNLPRGAQGAEVELRIPQVCDPARRTFNVIGVLPGSDPLVSNEIIIVGAHYDHIGVGAGGQFFPGADDNASGTSVLIEIADVLKDTMLKPRRTIVFIAWTAEEAGLVGSNYFVANPPFPLQTVRLNINLDMVGIGTPKAFVAVGTSHDSLSILKESASDLGITLSFNTRVGPSDHLALAREKIPSFLIYASGEHPNYHTPQDVPSSLNMNVLENAARLAVVATWRAANE